MERQMVIVKLMHHQKGLCAFCSERLVSPVIDHDHFTDMVRALLCTRCNSAEGRASQDDPAWSAYRMSNPAMEIGLKVSYWRL